MGFDHLNEREDLSSDEYHMQKRRPATRLSKYSTIVVKALLVMRYLVWGLFICSGLVIASLNSEAVLFNYFWNTATLPLYLLLLLSVTIGFLIGVGFNLASHIKLHAHNRRLQQKISKFSAEIIRLKRDFSPD